MSLFLEKLASDASRHGTGRATALLGKQAARRYIAEEAGSLSDAVHSVVEDNPGLSRDQVQRVVEAANQATWQELFHAGGNNVDFAPADSSAVLESLSSRHAVVVAPDDDYRSEPPQSSDDLPRLFPETEREELPLLNPAAEIAADQEKAASAHDALLSRVNQLEGQLEARTEELYGHIKQAYLQHDHGLLQIGSALKETLDDPDFGVHLVKVAAIRLRREGVPFDRTAELRKAANPVVVDDSHPLLKTAAAVEIVTRALSRASEAKEKVAAIHKGYDCRVRRTLRSA